MDYGQRSSMFTFDHELLAASVDQLVHTNKSQLINMEIEESKSCSSYEGEIPDFYTFLSGNSAD